MGANILSLHGMFQIFILQVNLTLGAICRRLFPTCEEMLGYFSYIGTDNKKLGIAERRLTESPPDEESCGRGQVQISVRPKVTLSRSLAVSRPIGHSTG